MDMHTEERMEVATLWLLLFLAVFHRPVMLIFCWCVLTLGGYKNLPWPTTLSGWMFG